MIAAVRLFRNRTKRGFDRRPKPARDQSSSGTLGLLIGTYPNRGGSPQTPNVEARPQLRGAIAEHLVGELGAVTTSRLAFGYGPKKPPFTP